MSHSYGSSLQTSQSEQLQELMNEVAFQKVLLSTIDDTVEERVHAEKEIYDEIKRLEKKIRDIKRRRLSGAIKTSTPQTGPSTSSSTSSRAARQRELDRNPESTYVENHDPSRRQATPSSDQATPKSTNSLAELLSPSSQMSLPTRKRTLSKHLDGSLLDTYQEPKSQRTSPCPARSMTPDVSSGDEFEAFDREFFNQQTTNEERFQRQKEDEQLARSLQNDWSSSRSLASQTAAPSSSMSAFDRIQGLRPPPAISSSSRPSVEKGSITKELPEPSSSKPRSGIKPDSNAASAGIKPEPSGLYPNPLQSSFGNNFSNFNSNYKALPLPMPGSYQNDSSDADDSDIEIINPSSFKDNGRWKNPQRPAFDWKNPASNDNPSRSMGLGTAAANINPQMGVHYGYPNNNSYNDLYHDRYAPQHVLGATAGHGYNPPAPSRVPGIASFFDPNSSILPASASFPTGEPNWLLNSRMAEMAEYLVNDPRKTNQEIQDLLENIRADEDLPPEDREGTPDALKYPLYEHQKLALTWLKSMEEGSNKGGILADDMGLGKTISALALMVARPSTELARKTNLIVGPVALLHQWAREIRNKIAVGHRLSVKMVHGQNKKLSWDDLRNFDVVLTTYGTLAAEYKRLESFHEKLKLDGVVEYDQAPMKKDFPLLGPHSKFFRVFLDEAQYIKNKATQSARACCKIQSVHRFCLTGTPMMNNVGEMYSLIHFLRIKPYNELQTFQKTFSVLTKGHGSNAQVKNAMRRLQALLKAILLRRVKTSLIDGKPIITLPPKTEEIQHVVFSADEQAFYKSLETSTQLQFNKYLRAGTVGKNYSNVLVLLLRLRQACCHPHLIHDFEEPATNDLSDDAMINLAKSLSPVVVARILAAEGSFDCPVCYDAALNPAIIIPCGHDTCSECLTKISDQAAQQNLADGNETAASSKCPTCRGILDKRSVIDYKTFKKVFQPQSEAGDDENTRGSSDDCTDSDTESDSGHESDLDSDGDLRNFVVPDDFPGDTTEDEDDSNEKPDETTASAQKPKPKIKKGRGKGKGKAKKGKKPKTGKKEHVSLAMLKKRASRSAEDRRKYMRYLKKNWQPSAKIEKCMELLERFQNDGNKTIIFSQFVSLLDLLQIPIDRKRWQCERYDGSMSGEARNSAIVRFTDKPNTNIMLISLKAGNAGLNLVAASRVIILDPFWNPFIEMQAVDRAYRIGQQLPVQVHRILIEATVEDRIIELQEQKRKLVNAALDEGASKSLGRLDVRQLAFLFGLGNSDQSTNSE